jgi:polysaccharide transporter, PST family
MRLNETLLWSAGSTIFKVLFGFVFNKLVAVSLGPSGMAIVGQFQNLLVSFASLATAGIKNGIVRYIAQSRGREDEVRYVLSAALYITIVSSLIVSIGILALSKIPGLLSFGGTVPSELFLLVPVMVFSTSFTGVIIGYLNGMKRTKHLVLVSVTNNLLGIGIAYLLIESLALKGALLVLLITPVTSMLIGLFFVRQKLSFFFSALNKRPQKVRVVGLLKYTLMAMATAISIPVAHLIIRAHVVDEVSLPAAGLWTGLTRISDAYLLVLTLTFSIYYLPRLSEISKQSELVREVYFCAKYITCIAALLAMLVYFLRELVVLVLFDKSFLAMTPLFAAQMLGDVFKVFAFSFGYVLVAKGETLAFVVVEITLAISLVCFVYLLVPQFGVLGTSYAFALNGAIHLLIVFLFFQWRCAQNFYDGEKN